MRWIAFLFATATASLIAGTAHAQAAQLRVTFDSKHITSVRTSGLADQSSGRRVTIDDPVRVASVSKLLVALGVMRLVEAGKLDLNRDVSAYLGAIVRNPNFPDTPVTLEYLLSHTSGLTDDADYIIPLGESVLTKLSGPKAWDKAHRPGTYFRYTNLNFPVIASVMEAATGERFDMLMARLVFNPLRIDACFNWTTCSNAKVRRAVVLYGADGSVKRDEMNGVRPPCPTVAAADGSCDLTRYAIGSNGGLFSPQGGLRISARDLARVGQMLLKNGGRYLKPASLDALIEPRWVYEGDGVDRGATEHGFFCLYGLGIQILGSTAAGCNDNLFGDGHVRYGHAGDAYGLRSGLWIDPKAKTGVAFFITAVPDDAPKGRSAFTAAEEAALQSPSVPPHNGPDTHHARVLPQP
ncbi:MAG: serine hydrolase domain-containing protein [Chakrabartia sp.]